MLATALVTPKALNDLATTGNPWYLVVILLTGLGLILKKIYDDGKKEKQVAEETALEREKLLMQRDDEHRAEAKERETEARNHNRELMQHLNATVTALSENTNVIRELSTTVEQMQLTQREMQVTQQETVESVRHLNDDFHDIKSQIEQIQSVYNGGVQ